MIIEDDDDDDTPTTPSIYEFYIERNTHSIVLCVVNNPNVKEEKKHNNKNFQTIFYSKIFFV